MATRTLWLIIALVMVMLAVLIWFYPTNSDFRSENRSWNGARDFLERFQASPLSSLDALPAISEGSTLMVIPYVEFTTSDLQKVKYYVNSGGRLVVLDDYGFGNQILKCLGLETRFKGSQLLDPLFSYKNENFPRIINFASSPDVSKVESLVFNHATTLENTPRDQVIAWSSYFSFSDEDGDGKWDEGEPKGPLPVIASFKAVEGELVLIADPSILISSMLEMGDNQQFLRNVAQGQILLDQSHLPEVPLDEAKVTLEIGRNALATIWGILGLIGLVLALTLKPVQNNRGGQSG